MHASVLANDDAYESANVELPIKILQLKIAHLNWGVKVRDAFLKKIVKSSSRILVVQQSINLAKSKKCSQKRVVLLFFKT